MTNGRLPLSRFKVLDLTRARAGPTAVRQLGDLVAAAPRDLRSILSDLRHHELALRVRVEAWRVQDHELGALPPGRAGLGPDQHSVAFQSRLGRTPWIRPYADQVLSELPSRGVKKVAVIDRNVLRIAAYELLHCDDIPPKVAINEAIELGKRYSTQNSGGFINGILDKVKDRIAPDGDSGDSGGPASGRAGDDGN